METALSMGESEVFQNFSNKNKNKYAWETVYSVFFDEVEILYISQH
jgi:hypothetical protein